MDTLTTYLCAHEDAMSAYAEQFSKQLKIGDCVALYGDLGAGKTFFVRGVCKGLGIESGVRSPTFTLMNVYEASDYRVYHMDLYRLNDEDEIYDIGYDDCIDGTSIVFIEWPEKIESLLPENVIRVHITITSDEAREVIITRR